MSSGLEELGRAKDEADIKAHERGCICSCCRSLMYWTGCKCCCCDTDNLDEHGLDHIVLDRECTDVPVCLLFIAILVIDLILFCVAISLEADPRWLLYYADWEGNICAPGESGTFKTKTHKLQEKSGLTPF